VKAFLVLGKEQPLLVLEAQGHAGLDVGFQPPLSSPEFP
jgi:hypothetical protein